jgi:hypothetical protein
VYLGADGPLPLTLRPGGLVLDCGANIGLFALWVLACQPRCSVLAVEPVPRYDGWPIDHPESMGSQTCRIVGKSQSPLMMIRWPSNLCPPLARGCRRCGYSRRLNRMAVCGRAARLLRRNTRAHAGESWGGGEAVRY